MKEEPTVATFVQPEWKLVPAIDYEVDRLQEANKELKRAVFYLMVRLWLLESEENND